MRYEEPREGRDLFETICRFALHRPATVVATSLVLIAGAALVASDLGLDQDFGNLIGPDHAAVNDLEAVVERTGGTAFLIAAVAAADRPMAESFIDAALPALEARPTVLFVDGVLDLGFIEQRQLLLLSPQELAGVVADAEAFIDRRLASATGLFVDLEADANANANANAEVDPNRNPKTDAEAEAEAKPEASAPGRAARAPTTLDTYLEELRSRHADRLPERYLAGADGRFLYLFIRLRGTSGDLAFGQRALAEVQAVLDELRVGHFANLEIKLAGSVMVRAEEDAVLRGDLARIGLIGFVAVVLLLVAYTRQARTLVIVSLPLLLGGGLTFALARVTLGRLNILTGFLASVLFGLGIDFAIHLHRRFREERGRGRAPAEAALQAVARTGPALAGGALTTAAALCVLLFADFEGYAEFGYLGAAGVLIMLLVSILVVPPLLVLFERRWPVRATETSSATTAPKGLHLPRWVQDLVLIGAPALAMYSALALARGEVGFHTNWRELKGTSPVAEFDDYIVESLGRSSTLTLVHVPDPAQLDDLASAVEAVRAQRLAKGLPSGLRDVLSIRDLVPADQEGRLEQIGALRAQLQRLRPERLSKGEREAFDEALALTSVEPLTTAELPRSLRRRFEPVQGPGSLALLTTPYLFYEVRELIEWAGEMRALRTELSHRGVEAPIMSENWVAGTVFGVILGDGPFLLWAAFGAVFVLLWLQFRSLQRALVVGTPLALGLVSIAGVMALLGMNLNFMNAVVLPAIVGIGIDGAIHVYHRYLQDGPDSVPVILRETIPATLLSTATTFVGFGVMVTAHHRGIRSVGELAMIGTSTTYLFTSLFFPVVLMRFGRRLKSSTRSRLLGSDLERDRASFEEILAAEIASSPPGALCAQDAALPCEPVPGHPVGGATRGAVGSER